MIENKEVSFTELSQLGEFGLINHLTKSFKNINTDTIKGVGDDAAVLDLGGDDYLLVSTDTSVEGIHFDRMFSPLQHVGYKSAVVNFSDIYAMNGTPLWITVSLTVSNQYSVEALEAVYEGIRHACKNYKVDLIGGDTTSSKSGMTISITVIGKVKKNKVVYRSGGKDKDILMVSSDLGAAYAGLQILQREKKVFLENPNIQPDLSDYQYTIERLLRPEASRLAVETFAELDIVPTSMIDISDGLASEVNHICKASGCGARIFQNKLPIDYETVKVAELFDIPSTTYALYGGDEYSLLFSVQQNDYEKLKHIKAFTPIGYLSTDAVPYLVLADGTAAELKAEGFNHFV